MKGLIYQLMLVSVIFSLSACGGGGGSSANDGDGIEDSTADTVTVTAATVNSVPIANAGIDQNVATGSVVTLNGVSSSDANGDTLSYSWAFVSKPEGSSASLDSETVVNPSFTADTEGSYVLSLVVNDGTDNSEIDSVTVTVLSEIFFQKMSLLGFTNSEIESLCSPGTDGVTSCYMNETTPVIEYLTNVGTTLTSNGVDYTIQHIMRYSLKSPSNVILEIGDLVKYELSGAVAVSLENGTAISFLDPTLEYEYSEFEYELACESYYYLNEKEGEIYDFAVFNLNEVASSTPISAWTVFGASYYRAAELISQDSSGEWHDVDLWPWSGISKSSMSYLHDKDILMKKINTIGEVLSL